MVKQFKKNFIVALLLAIMLNIFMPYLAFSDVGSNRIEHELENDLNEQRVKNALARSQATQRITKVTQDLEAVIKQQENNMLALAKKLFMFCFFMELVWIGLQAAIGRSNTAKILRDFVMSTFVASIFFAIIINYQEFTQYIVAVFSETTGGTINSIFSGLPFIKGLDLAEILTKGVENKGWGLKLIMYLISGLVIVIFALITLQVIILKAEMLVGVVCSVVLVGFGALSYLKNYAISAIRFIFSIGLKFMIVNVILALGFDIVNDMAILGILSPMDGMVIVATCLVLLTMIQKSADLISGVMSGFHSGGGEGVRHSLGTLQGVASSGLNMATMPFKGISSLASGVASIKGKFF